MKHVIMWILTILCLGALAFSLYLFETGSPLRLWSILGWMILMFVTITLHWLISRSRVPKTELRKKDRDYRVFVIIWGAMIAINVIVILVR